MMDTGVTYTRYYEILFGIFAAAAGVVLSFVPVRKNGIIAAMLIAFSLFSIIPPVDAFTVSRISQENVLRTVLTKNGMLENNTIKPKSNLPAEDKQKIIQSVQYLSMMNYTKGIVYFPANYKFEDFKQTFGFEPYELPDGQKRPISVFYDPTQPMGISGFDVLIRTDISIPNNFMEPQSWQIKKSGQVYTMTKEGRDGQYYLTVKENNGQELIRFALNDIFTRYSNYGETKSALTYEEALFTMENDRAKISVVVQSANINFFANETQSGADLYVLVQVK
jgi:hypothetical protein